MTPRLHTFAFALSWMLTACAVGPSGMARIALEESGEEYVATGVVTALWRYDVDENRTRLDELIPNEHPGELARLSSRHQVIVLITSVPFYHEYSEVALLPEGWTYTTSSHRGEEGVLNIGDVVDLSAKRNRGVDRVLAVRRKCSEEPAEDEKAIWKTGCLAAKEFNARGLAWRDCKKSWLGRC